MGQQYRIKEHAPPHFIGGQIRAAGDIVVLPDGVTAGKWLEPVGQEPAATPSAPAKGKSKGAKAPEPDQQPETPVDPTEGEF